MTIFYDDKIYLSTEQNSLPLDQFAVYGVIAVTDYAHFTDNDSLVEDTMSKLLGEARQKDINAIIDIKISIIQSDRANVRYCTIYGTALVSKDSLPPSVKG